MSYLSISFVLFVSVTVLAFYLLPVRFRGLVLFVASMLFYASYDIRYLLYLLFVAGTTFCCAKYVDHSKIGRYILTGSIVINAAMWYLIKQFSWAVNLANVFLGFSPAEIVLPQVFRLVPVGLSYYMLQAFSYLVDVYRGKLECERKFWKYLLYLSYFPAVVQGPISRYGDLAPQFTHRKKFNYEQFANNSILILFGLVKKMVVADRLNIFVSYCFKNIDQLNGSVLYLGAVAFAFQLYADFSGCVDICRGVSGYLGIDLVQNFESPYFARSIKEFWNRWHLSLSRWLRDYVYIPLGGNRRGKLRKYLNLGVTFLVSGIWHGAGFTYIIWGCLHAMYQIIGECTLSFREKVKQVLGIEKDSVSDQIYQRIITFQLTLFAWIFFRAESVESAILYIKRIVTDFNIWVLLTGQMFTGSVTFVGMLVLVLHIVLIMKVDRYTMNRIDAIRKVRKLHVFLRYGIYMLILLDLLFFGVYGGYDASAFLYGGY